MFQSAAVKEAKGCGSTCGCPRVTENLESLDSIFSIAMEPRIERYPYRTAWAYNTATYFQNEYLIFKREQEERAKRISEKYPSKAPKPRDFK